MDLAQVRSQTENVLLAKLISLNSEHVSFPQCGFSRAGMHQEMHDGTNKDGSGRVALFNATQNAPPSSLNSKPGSRPSGAGSSCASLACSSSGLDRAASAAAAKTGSLLHAYTVEVSASSMLAGVINRRPRRWPAAG
jgi:hypothetical protein